MNTIKQIVERINSNLEQYGLRAKLWEGKRVTRIYISEGRKEVCNYEFTEKTAVRNGSNFGNFDYNTGKFIGEGEEDYGASTLEAEGYQVVKGA